MIILDTNVVSEAMRGPRANPVVLAWIRGLSETPATTVINRAEILAGVAALPEGARKDRLADASRAAFDTLGACLPLTPECADAYAAIIQQRRSIGRPVGGMDALIAGIARVSGAAVATRDLDDFAGLGIELIDPWTP